MRLSKSRITSSLQCLKRLHFEVYQKELAVYTAAEQARFDEGNAVGEAARTIYDNGRGVLIEYEPAMAAALKATRELISGGFRDPIFEATFEHAGVLVRVDVLLPAAAGWRMVEVKSSSKLKDEHVPDCAIQAWVLEGAGIDLEGIALAHVDREFVLPESRDLSGLLIEEDLTHELEPLREEVPSWVAAAKEVVAKPLPDVPVGRHCTSPYRCPFFDQCWPADADYPVQDLGGSWSKRAELVASDYRDLREVPAAELNSSLHHRIHRITTAGEPELIEGARLFSRRLSYPRYHLDFETVAPAIPIWPGTGPYQLIPFQWSCHIEEGPEQVRHEEFLDLTGELPVRPVAESLIEALGESGPILMYSPYERTVINQMRKMIPDLDAELAALVDRLIDLKPPTKQHYYHPQMHGSWSLKAVLPTVAPDLDYAALREIQEGTAASKAFLEAIDPATPDERREEIRRQLLAYCKLDTEAMVRLVGLLGG